MTNDIEISTSYEMQSTPVDSAKYWNSPRGSDIYSLIISYKVTLKYVIDLTPWITKTAISCRDSGGRGFRSCDIPQSKGNE